MKDESPYKPKRPEKVRWALQKPKKASPYDAGAGRWVKQKYDRATGKWVTL